MKRSQYGGWSIWYDPRKPITGRFRGIRHGVTICAESLKTLFDIIDLR